MSESISRLTNAHVEPYVEDIADLAMRGISGLHWITRHLQQFSPIKMTAAEKFGIKAFGELALLYLHLKNVSAKAEFQHFSLPQFLPVWEEFLRQECQVPAYAELPRKRPAEGFDTLVPYLMLRATGYRDDYHEVTLSRLRRMGFPEAAERVASHIIPTHYFLWKSGLVGDEPNWAGLYQETILSRVRSRIPLNALDAYSITHVVMYITDFGLRPLPLDAAEVARIIDLIECLTIEYWRKGHWDLLGELLMNLAALGARGTPLYLGAKQALHAVWRDDGAIPAWSSQQKMEIADPVTSDEPGLLQSENQERGKQEGELIGDDQAAEFFKLHYHSTLVGIFYCTASLLHPRVE